MRCGVGGAGDANLAAAIQDPKIAQPSASASAMPRLHGKDAGKTHLPLNLGGWGVSKFCSFGSIDERDFVADADLAAAAARRHCNGKRRVLLAHSVGQGGEDRQIALAG